ncbi:hypothetical protein BDV97DRAFT_347508 [Delphinella strobiligena]|nr:hypothetical protein BDV97DRAFT_347508 [Delphinella strobiligena]
MAKHSISTVRMIFMFEAVSSAFGLCVMYMSAIDSTMIYTASCHTAYRQLFIRTFGGTGPAHIKDHCFRYEWLDELATEHGTCPYCQARPGAWSLATPFCPLAQCPKVAIEDVVRK